MNRNDTEARGGMHLRHEMRPINCLPYHRGFPIIVMTNGCIFHEQMSGL
jgi:hypothetical protein